jgi:hypothetical protein
MKRLLCLFGHRDYVEMFLVEPGPMFVRAIERATFRRWCVRCGRVERGSW